MKYISSQKILSLQIISKLNQQNYKAYLVGGCVRDKLLKILPKDYDIVTSATPDEIQKIFPNTKSVGKNFGVIIVRQNNIFIEVSTFRKDFDYDGRKPRKIEFASEKEDAMRRDFTINGLFLDVDKDEIIDYIGGKKDLENKILRFIGNPKEKIEEDYLRILRAIRFKNKFVLEYDDGTKKALLENISLINNLSRERIVGELKLILDIFNFDKTYEDMISMGVFEVLFPNIKIFQKTIKNFANTSWISRLVFILSLNSLEVVKKDLKHLKFSKSTIQVIYFIFKYKNLKITELTKRQRNFFFMNKDILHFLDFLKLCDVAEYNEITNLYENRKPQQENIIDGKDLLELGFEGKQIGEVLFSIKEKYLLEQIDTKKEALECVHS